MKAAFNMPRHVVAMSKLNVVIGEVVDAVIPSRYAKRWAGGQYTWEREQDSDVLKCLGDLTLHALGGKIPLDPEVLEEAWMDVKARGSGVVFTDVFDPHKASVLEGVTPLPTVSIIHPDRTKS